MDLLSDPAVPEISSNWAYIVVAAITAIGGWLVARATNRSVPPEPKVEPPATAATMHPIHAQMLTDIHRETIEIGESLKSLHRRTGGVETRLEAIEVKLPRPRPRS